RRIHLDAGEQFLNADIHLPGGYGTRLVRVQVSAPPEMAPNEVFVSVIGSKGDRPFAAQSSPGQYEVHVLKDGKYEFRAFNWSLCSRDASSQTLTVDGSDNSVSEIHLELPKTSCDQ